MTSVIVREIRFYCRAALVIAIVLVAYVGVVALIDPFGIVPFSPSIEGFNAKKLRTAENTRLFKNYDVLLRRPEIVVFGSSRTNQAISAEKIEQITGRTAYNAGLDGGNSKEARALLESWLEHGVPIKEAYFELYYWRVIPRPDNPPPIRAIDFASDFRTAFFSIDALNNVYKTVAHNLAGDRFPAYRQDGMIEPRRGWVPRPPNGGLAKWWPRAESLFRPIKRADFEPMRLILETCQRRGIKCQFIMTPMHAIRLAHMMVAGHWESIRSYQRLAAEFLPVRDFIAPGPVGLTSLCAGSEYWYDPGHFSPHFGDLIVETLFKQTPPLRGFGAALTPETVTEQTAALEASVKRWLNRNPTFAVKEPDGTRSFHCG